MKARQVISNQMIEDLLVTALEGGSNYWFYLPDTRMCEGYESKNPIYNKPTPLSLQIHEAVLDGKEVPIMDAETVELYDKKGKELKEPKGDHLGFISKVNYERAEELLLDKHPHVLGNILGENYDANDADVWFQLVVMGELVYG